HLVEAGTLLSVFGTADARVAVDLYDVPPSALGDLPELHLLVLDRLAVSADPDVERGPRYAVCSVQSSLLGICGLALSLHRTASELQLIPIRSERFQNRCDFSGRMGRFSEGFLYGLFGRTEGSTRPSTQGLPGI